ncbi:MAG TPA: hypothetical protein VNL98_03315 [Gemmatimonadales bacterium]|nr:hypothetical protein [Gemmatimonadales bacterium]
MIVRARAPLRIDLAGGWTDVAPYAGTRGGAVVNIAIALYARVTLRSGGQGVRLRAVDYDSVVTARSADELRADGELSLVKAVVRRLAPQRPLEIVTASDGPPGSGLGGSGAMGVALVAALRLLRGEAVPAALAAGEAFEIETEDAGVVGGRQDQYAAALGGVQFLSFGSPEVSATRLQVPEGALRELESASILCYTGTSRLSGDTHRRVWKAFASGDAVVGAALDGLKAAALQMRRALEQGDIGLVARLVSENWRHQQALAPGMRTPLMERLERVAIGAGADGAKACGAGAGGCMLFIARPGREHDVAEALRQAGAKLLPVVFDATGVAAWETGDR